MLTSENIHIVLVEPGNSLNIGAVARAMGNLGCSNLHLVSPPDYKPEVAANSACWATGILDSARVYTSLDEALAPMAQVVGFSAREGADRPRVISLPQWAAQIAADPPGPVGLLFGPEDHGLERHHLTHCRWLVRIPSAAANPSFNLSQAVILALWQINQAGEGLAPPRHGLAPPRQGLAAAPETDSLAVVDRPLPGEEGNPRRAATMEEFAQLDRLVDEVLTRCRFYGSGTPRPIPDMVKHIFRRTDADKRDMGILMGVFGKINRALAGRVPTAPIPPGFDLARKEGRLLDVLQEEEQKRGETSA